MRVDVWSDLVCPWCFVGKRRFERALAFFPHREEIELVHRAYLLYGSSPRGASLDRREMLMAKYGLSRDQADAMNAGMEQTAAAEGLEYHLSGGATGNTFDAHQVVYLGRDRGMQEAVLERFYRAFFTEQRSIFDRESLIQLGAEAGLQRDDVARTLADDAYAEQIEFDLAEAQAIPVTGVPFFVFENRYAVSGAQKPETFTRALACAWADANPPPTTTSD